MYSRLRSARVCTRVRARIMRAPGPIIFIFLWVYIRPRTRVHVGPIFVIIGISRARELWLRVGMGACPAFRLRTRARG